MNTKYEAGQVAIVGEAVMQKIYIVRGQKVMIDRDLAVLYGYETKRMNEQVKRNQERFPASFMFQLTAEEEESLRSQFATANTLTKTRTLPYAFTEYGVLMLASVLKSETAIKASVHIIEVFVKLREMVLTHKDILLKLEQLEQQQATQDISIKQLLQYIKLFMTEKQKPRPQIGFKVK
jgi:ORF6N domain